MSFAKALALQIELEGGLVLTDREEDAGGPTFAGLTRRTVENARFAWVPPFDEHQLSVMYLNLFWNPYRCELWPEPADAVFFQAACNLPWRVAWLLAQCVAGAYPDGVKGAVTLAAIADLRKTQPGDCIARAIIAAQRMHYSAVGKGWDIHGLFNRTCKVEDAMKAGRI